MDTHDTDPDWLSTKEAAELLDVPIRTLYRLIDRGRLPAYKFGRVIRLRHHEVTAYLEGGSDNPDGGLEGS